MNSNVAKQVSASAGAVDLVPASDFPTLDLDACALLLDIDGTLLDFAPTPREVKVPAGLVPTLSGLDHAWLPGSGASDRCRYRTRGG